MVKIWDVLNESRLGDVATFSGGGGGVGGGIPLDNGQRKEGILTGIIASVNLT